VDRTIIPTFMVIPEYTEARGADDWRNRRHTKRLFRTILEKKVMEPLEWQERATGVWKWVPVSHGKREGEVYLVGMPPAVNGLDRGRELSTDSSASGWQQALLKMARGVSLVLLRKELGTHG